jgi:hypothetical protein
MLKSVRLLMFLAALSVAPQGQAATIVDTGTPTVLPNSNWSFDPGQYFAGEFSTTDTYTVQGVEGYFSNQLSIHSSGVVTIGIHADGGNIPGALLFSSTVNLAAGAVGWFGVSFNQLLGPGTYWASFTPSPGILATMPGRAPNPLAEYALGQYGGWLDRGADSWDDLDLGIRVSGDLQAVPDSTTTLELMIIVGLLGVVVQRWRLGSA